MEYFGFIFWLVVSIPFGVLMAYQLYKHCSVRLTIKFEWDFVETSDENELKKLSVFVENVGIKRVLIKEIGLYNVSDDKFFVLNRFIGESSAMPVWLEEKKSVKYIQYKNEIPTTFVTDMTVVRAFIIDSEGNYYYSTAIEI